MSELQDFPLPWELNDCFNHIPLQVIPHGATPSLETCDQGLQAQIWMDVVYYAKFYCSQCATDVTKGICGGKKCNEQKVKNGTIGPSSIGYATFPTCVSL